MKVLHPGEKDLEFIQIELFCENHCLKNENNTFMLKNTSVYSLYQRCVGYQMHSKTLGAKNILKNWI